MSKRAKFALDKIEQFLEFKINAEIQGNVSQAPKSSDRYRISGPIQKLGIDEKCHTLLLCCLSKRPKFALDKIEQFLEFKINAGVQELGHKYQYILTDTGYPVHP